MNSDVQYSLEGKQRQGYYSMVYTFFCIMVDDANLNALSCTHMVSSIVRRHMDSEME